MGEIARYPLPTSLMGIKDHRLWDRFAIQVATGPNNVTVSVVELKDDWNIVTHSQHTFNC